MTQNKCFLFIRNLRMRADKTDVEILQLFVRVRSFLFLFLARWVILIFSSARAPRNNFFRFISELVFGTAGKV